MRRRYYIISIVAEEIICARRIAITSWVTCCVCGHFLARHHRCTFPRTLISLSILDPLTGLHTRRFGEERLQEEIERAETNRDTLAVVILDLGHFKEIND